MSAAREQSTSLQASDLFLTDEELRTLTGRCQRRLQIAQLKRMLIPFHVNALGRPVVVRTALTGTGDKKPPAPAWKPRVVNG